MWKCRINFRRHGNALFRHFSRYRQEVNVWTACVRSCTVTVATVKASASAVRWKLWWNSEKMLEKSTKVWQPNIALSSLQTNAYFKLPPCPRPGLALRMRCAVHSNFATNFSKMQHLLADQLAWVEFWNFSPCKVHRCVRFMACQSCTANLKILRKV